jgi:hypothetical protein
MLDNLMESIEAMHKRESVSQIMKLQELVDF